MFEVGWTEMLVIAIVMIVVVGPKDLPNMLRTFGRTTAKLRTMAADFQKQFNEALKEAELDDVKKSVDSLRSLNPAAEIRKQLNPFEKAAAEIRSGVDAVMKPKPAADPAAPAVSTPQPAEPLKNGATVMPAVGGPEATLSTPVFPAMTDSSVVPASTVPPKKASAAKAKLVPAKATKAAAPATKAAAKAPATIAGTTVKSAPAKAPVSTASAKASPKTAKAAAVTKAVPAKAEQKPAPAVVKKPAKAATKTAGAAK